MSPSRRRQVGSVAFVGAGPGDDGLLTTRGAELLSRADVIVADGPVDPALLVGARPDAEVVDAVAAVARSSRARADRIRLSVGPAREGKRVVRLLPGDPGTFGGLAEEAADCARARVPFEVVPGVPTALAVPVYAGVPLTNARVTQVSLVDATPGRRPLVDWAALARAGGTLVVSNPLPGLPAMAEALVDGGRAPDEPAALTWHGTTTAQRTLVSTLRRVAADAAAAGAVEPAVLVVGEVVSLREALSWFETKPLFGWKVLVPRTMEQAGSLTARLRSYGAVPVQVPTIAVEPPRTPQVMDRAVTGVVSGRYQWVAFTSANAVRAVREKVEELGLDARAFAGVKVAAVGEVTGQALAGWGIRPDLQPTGQQSSEGLLAEWPEYDRRNPLDRVFLPRADIATETLSAGLKEKGWQVDDVTAYRTVRAAPPPAPIREAIKTGGFDAVLFTSSSTVRNLVGIAGKPHQSTVIAAIGPQTAHTAEELGLRVDVLSEAPSAEALADALASFGVQRRLTDQQDPPGKANRAKTPPPVRTAR